MVGYEYQTCLRMSNTLKDDMTDICENQTVNESDLIRRAIATFVQNLNGKTEDQTKYLFVWRISRIYNGYYIPLDRIFLSVRYFPCLPKKDVKEGASVVV